MKSALFVQDNVAVNTKLISKVPFLFGNFDVFKKIFGKNVQFLYGMSMVWREKFLGALFNIQKCPWMPVPPPPPPSLDASYAPIQICSQDVGKLCSHCCFPVVETSLEQAVNNLYKLDGIIRQAGANRAWDSCVLTSLIQ
jgi:hypothetical protein